MGTYGNGVFKDFVLLINILHISEVSKVERTVMCRDSVQYCGHGADRAYRTYQTYEE